MQTPTVTEFTADEKLDCLKREIALRRWVYRNRVKARTMRQECADREIAIMLAIARDYGGHGDQHD